MSTWMMRRSHGGIVDHDRRIRRSSTSACIGYDLPRCCLVAAVRVRCRRRQLSAPRQHTGAAASAVAIDLPQETHLKNVKQLTNGGENAEAYFSFDGTAAELSEHRGSHGCDQIYTMKIDGTDLQADQHATRAGRRAASTTRTASICFTRPRTWAATPCPPPPSMAQGYVWAVYDTYDIFRANPDGSNPMRLTSTPGYDAEATIAKDGRVVFTSVRDGDMDIYSMNGDGIGRAPAHESARSGRRRLLLTRRIADRLPRLSSASRAPSSTTINTLLKKRVVAADVARDLRDEPRRQQSAPGHALRQARTGRRTGRPTASASSSRRT